MLEKMIVEHCSPALAGLKTANMFTCKFSSIDTFSGELLDIKRKLSGKGVFVEILRINGNRALVYVYRRKRLENDCFPHEIGLFLDYPLPDVVGFIEQGGKNCKYCGIWKVYSNECETKALFDRFRKCKEVYQKVFARGRTLADLTVAA